VNKNDDALMRAYVMDPGTRPALGLTMIETLVALVILSVGLLGIAALHVESVRSARGATLRTKAITLAGDMAEKMRANRTGTLGNDYICGPNDTGADHECDDDDDGVATASCDPAEMADHDIWQWKERIANPQSGLPEGATAAITSDGALNPTFTISLSWEENDADQSIELQMQP
jgi:type IV pilus assembly protein PilV